MGGRCLVKFIMKMVHEVLFFFKGNEKENKMKYKEKYVKFEIKVLKRKVPPEKK